jgi:hypothetical protein
MQSNSDSDFIERLDARIGSPNRDNQKPTRIIKRKLQVEKIILILEMTAFSRVALSQCEIEQKQVDRWNSILKNKVTERARNKHREAKKVFLDCLRQPTEAVQTKSPTISSTKTPRTTKTKYKF